MQVNNSVRLSPHLMAAVATAAKLNMRSIPKQIEYWAYIGQIVEDNPDLSFDFIRQCLKAKEEPSVPFEFESE